MGTLGGKGLTVAPEAVQTAEGIDVYLAIHGTCSSVFVINQISWPRYLIHWEILHHLVLEFVGSVPLVEKKILFKRS